MSRTFLILFLWLEDFSGGISPLLEVPLSEKRKWRSAGGSMGRERGGGGGFDAGCLLFKARFSPDTSVLFINSFSRAVKNQCALHCKQFRGWREKKLNCKRIDLFKYNNTALQRGEEEARAPRQRLTGSMKPQAVIDKLLAKCKYRSLLSN